MLDFESQSETFVWECIETRITIDDIYKRIPSQYWETLKEKLGKAKEILPSIFRIGETVFTSMAVIGGRLFSNHPKNLNHVHKDSKDLFSFIITLGKYISGVYTVFYDGLKTSDLGSRDHVLKDLHVGIIFGLFGKKIMKVIFEEDIDQ